ADSRRETGTNHAGQRGLASQQQLAASGAGPERQETGAIDQLADVQGVFAGPAGGIGVASHRFRESDFWWLPGIGGGQRRNRLLEGWAGDLRQRPGGVSLSWRANFLVFLDDNQRPGRGAVARLRDRGQRGAD